MDGEKSSRVKTWISWGMSGIVILFMLMDSIMKFIQPEEVITGTTELGFPKHHILTLGILAFVSTVLHIIPRTTILGAILLTGYFGGVVATHLCLDNPLFSHTLFTVYFGILMWGGLWLRDERIRNLIPFQNPNKKED